MKIPVWFELMFLTNQWAVFHTFGGVFIGRALLVRQNVAFHKIIISVLIMAVVWELVELYCMNGATSENGIITLTQAVVKEYGSWYGWAMDSLGDVVVAVFAAAVVAL